MRWMGLLLGAATLWQTAGRAARYELSNDRVSIVFDDGGNLVELTNRQSAHRYVMGKGKPPWRMYYRQGSPVTGALDLEVDPSLQNAQVRRDHQALVLSYEKLLASTPRRGQTRELRVGLEVRVALERDSLIWSANISNRETDPSIEVTELWLPWLYGVRDLGLGAPADVLYWPERAGRRIPDPYRQIAASAPGREPALRLTYPFPASMQWFTLNNGEEGIYVGSHDRSLMTTCLNVMTHEGGVLSASIVKYPFVAAGETWTSEPVVVRVYKGTWHQASRTYRAWTDTWLDKPDAPAWLRRSPGWVLPFFKGQSGHITATYSDLPGMFRQAQAAGITVLNCFGWVKQGFDNLYPEYETDEALGGEPALRTALGEVQRAGGHTILYTQGQLIDPSSDYYRKIGHAIVARDIWGYEYRESYGGGGAGTLLNVMRNKYFGIACPSAAGWIDQLHSQLGMVADLGAQGILFDQMGGIPPYICFSKQHPHRKPSLAVGPEKVRNMMALRKTMKARDPEFAFVIELATDCYTPYADIIHSHGIGFWPEPEAFGEMFRYTFPEPIITNRDGGPYTRRAQLAHAFALGWRFDARLRDIEDAAVGPYFEREVALRNKYPDLLLGGRFVDNEGFVANNSNVSAHAFRAGNQLAVTLWNPGDTPQRVRVLARGYHLEAAEWQDPAWSGPDHSLLAGDIAVFIFRQDQ